MTKTFALEGFEPIKRIGGGGFGDVWLAKQTNVDRDVAIKVGHAPIQDEIIRLRFERECKALGRLSGHPNIIDVFTAGSLDDGRPYLVLEYIDGGTLWQRLKRSPMSDDELITVGEQLAGALAEAHSSGVLHRDLKPENILMRSNGDAVLGDFGIARLQDGMNTTSAAITASVAYAAPEVLGGTHASAASDLYGIGICLLAAILRSVPFVDKGDKSIHPIITRVMSDDPPDLRTMGVSEDLAKVVESLLQKDPSKRPTSAVEVQQMFRDLRSRSWQSDQHLVSAPTPSTSRRATSTSIGTLADQSGTWGGTQGGGPADTGVHAEHGGNGYGSRPPQTGARLGSAAAPGQTPYSPVADGLDGKSKDVDSRNNMRAFAMAYVATVAVGALLIVIIAQLLS